MHNETTRKELQKSTDEKVVKRCIGSLVVDHNVLPYFTGIVDTVSKMMNKCSLVLNVLLIHCCENNIEFPEVNSHNSLSSVRYNWRWQTFKATSSRCRSME